LADVKRRRAANERAVRRLGQQAGHAQLDLSIVISSNRK
jgi:hypothetical protein